MPINKYVLSKYISGTSDADAQLVIQQAVRANRFEIDDPVDLIAGDMFASLEDFIDIRYTPEQIRDLIEKSGKFRLLTFDRNDKSKVSGVYLRFDEATKTYMYDIRGKLKVRQIYEVTEINDADVAYLVSEHIVAPESGVSLVERCYHPVFDKLQDAIKYRDARMANYAPEKGTNESGWRILVVNRQLIESDTWYKGNLAAYTLIKDKGLDVNKYRYIGDIKDLQEAVLLDCYDDLSTEEQASINYAIYMELRPYIPDEEADGLDDQMFDASDDEMEAITDLALILCLVQAPDKETFDKVHEVLGRAAWRIESLTNEFYDAHRDEGYILVSSTGEMKWYPDVYFMNEWEGNKIPENIWFGKFQPNDNSALQCFAEYSPQLIVDRFPTLADMKSLERRYLVTIAREHAAHEEMIFTDGEDDEGNVAPVCMGDWYFDGLGSRNVYKGIYFARKYGDHLFDEEECKKLLNGEEITVENFVTKSGRAVTIRGKLKRVNYMFDPELQVGFVRTDINAANRRLMGAQMGIDVAEPGLPEEENNENPI